MVPTRQPSVCTPPVFFFQPIALPCLAHGSSVRHSSLGESRLFKEPSTRRLRAHLVTGRHTAPGSRPKTCSSWRRRQERDIRPTAVRGRFECFDRFGRTIFGRIGLGRSFPRCASFLRCEACGVKVPAFELGLLTTSRIAQPRKLFIGYHKKLSVWRRWS